jgi:hypothetical protein
MMEDEAEGVWGHIVSLVPSVEVFEIENLVGSSLIADNSALWRELKAFNSILTELHTLEFDEPLSMTPRLASSRMPGSGSDAVPLSSANLELLSAPAQSAGNGPAAKSSSATATSSATSAIASAVGTVAGASGAVPALPLVAVGEHNQHQRHQEASEGSLTRRSNASVDSMEFIFAIQDRLTVDKIQGVLEEIRRALRSEKRELEAEIALLFSAMEGEADSASSRQRKGSSGAVTEGGSSGERRSPPPSPDTMEGPKDLCISCSRVRGFAAQQPGRIRKAVAERDARDRQLCFSCMERERKGGDLLGGGGGEPGEPRGPRKTNRVRSRLQAARDEHHFLED